jgi:hypothetical protein
MPDAGDLVILLPDDNLSLADIAQYEARGEVLFSFDPIIPRWLYFKIFPSVLFDNMNESKEHPNVPMLERLDGWLHASVIAWK